MPQGHSSSPVGKPEWKELSGHRLVSQGNDHCGSTSSSPGQAFRRLLGWLTVTATL